MFWILAIILLAAFVHDAEWLLDLWFEKKIIVDCQRQPYLHRWYLFRSKPVTLFAHKFVNSDEDRALHDHPWAFIVIPIWRGYIEHNEILAASPAGIHRWDNKTRVLPFVGARYRDFHYRHRVELMKNQQGEPLPSWSIFFHFTRRREWGYWPATGFISHSKWWQSLCE